MKFQARKERSAVNTNAKKTAFHVPLTGMNFFPFTAMFHEKKSICQN